MVSQRCGTLILLDSVAAQGNEVKWRADCENKTHSTFVPHFRFNQVELCCADHGTSSIVHLMWRLRRTVECEVVEDSQLRELLSE